MDIMRFDIWRPSTSKRHNGQPMGLDDCLGMEMTDDVLPKYAVTAEDAEISETENGGEMKEAEEKFFDC